MAKPINAFVARSFADNDVEKIQPLLDALQTFEKLGFICQSADAAEPELVSQKVQRMIRDCDVFIAFFTRKYPVYDEPLGGLGTAVRWTAPSWVLQESGCAVGANKKLIFFRELGVELPSLQGDLEYIEFDPKDLTESLRKVNEMVLSIVAKGLSIEVITTVQQDKQNSPPPEPQQEKSSAEAISATEDGGIIPFVRRLVAAFEAQDFEAARLAYDEGLTFLRTDEPETELAWTLMYEQERFRTGHADAWDALEQLREQGPDYRVVQVMARCLSLNEETAEAAEMYQAAAGMVTDPEKRVVLLGAAAIELDKLKEFDRARAVLIEAFRIAKGTNRTSILRKLYTSLKQAEKTFEAFGVGEYSIAQNSAQADLHFTLGYDYSDASLHELAAFHYKTALQQNPKDAAALNNLGVVYSGLEMPISSVKSHSAAAELGNTLASGNLAFKYLDAGMLQDAEDVIVEAAQEPEHHVMVDDAQAEIKKRQELEDAKNIDLLHAANQQRGFFKILGSAVLEGDVVDPQGTWSFPECEIPIVVNGEDIEGSATKNVRKSGFGSLFTEHTPERTESYLMSGKLEGRVCKFTLVVDTDLGGPGPVSTRHGYIVFSKDGSSGSVFENEPKVVQFKITKKPTSQKLLTPTPIKPSVGR